MKAIQFWTKGIILTSLMNYTFCGAFAQDSLNKQDVYRIWLKYDNQRGQKTGFLTTLSDTTLTLCSNRFRPDLKLVTYPVDHLKWVDYRSNRDVRKGFLLGGFIGFAAGYFFCAITFQDSEDFFKIPPYVTGLGFGAMAVLPGALAGGLLSILIRQRIENLAEPGR